MLVSVFIKYNKGNEDILLAALSFRYILMLFYLIPEKSNICLARSAKLPTRLYILLALFSFFYLFLMISRRTIISGSAGLIFAIFPPNEIVLDADDQSGPLFSISRGNQFCESGKLPTFVALAFRN